MKLKRIEMSCTAPLVLIVAILLTIWIVRYINHKGEVASKTRQELLDTLSVDSTSSDIFNDDVVDKTDTI